MIDKLMGERLVELKKENDRLTARLANIEKGVSAIDAILKRSGSLYRLKDKEGVRVFILMDRSGRDVKQAEKLCDLIDLAAID